VVVVDSVVVVWGIVVVDVVVVVVEVVEEVVVSGAAVHSDKLLMVKFPGWQQVSVEYWRNVNTSPSCTGTDFVPL
jgi:hypothetical protein